MTTATTQRGQEGTRLRTSRFATEPERSLLAILRSLMPRRPLALWETRRVAELQANRLIELSGLSEPPVPVELISELPRIEVAHVADLPVSGSAHWVSGRWRLSIAAGEHAARQRFSLAHEFKHVLDHPLHHVLYQDRDQVSAHDRAERSADYFAACLLMPKRWFVKAWGDGIQRPSELARHFGVSLRAVNVRLWQLGLVEPAQRCAPAALPRSLSIGGRRS